MAAGKSLPELCWETRLWRVLAILFLYAFGEGERRPRGRGGLASAGRARDARSVSQRQSNRTATRARVLPPPERALIARGLVESARRRNRSQTRAHDADATPTTRHLLLASSHEPKPKKQQTGYAILLPQLPTITANYFASRRAGYPIDCSTYGPGHAPSGAPGDSGSGDSGSAAPAPPPNNNNNHNPITPSQPPACVDGHADVVAWASVTSLLQNTVVGFLAAPLIGDLSDAHGRVPFAALGMALGLVPSGVVALYLRFPTGSVPLWAYYPASVLSGAVQASTVFLAYASDVMPPTHRVGSFAAIIAAFSLGFIIGPAVGASLEPRDAAAATFFIASCCALLTLLTVPESRSPEARASAARRSAPRPLDALLSLRRSAALLGSRDLFVRLALCMAVASVVSESVQDLLVQYLQLVAGFTTKDQGLLFVVIGSCNLLVQGILLPPLARRLGEVALLRGGLMLSAVEHVLLSFVRSRNQALAAVAVGSFAGVAWPAVGAIKANNCGPDEQGLVQGALASLRALATGIGPLGFAALYKACATAEAPLGFRPGLVFWAAALLTTAAVAVAFTLPLQAGCGSSGAGGVVAGGGGGLAAPDAEEERRGGAAGGGGGSSGGGLRKYEAVGTRDEDDEEDDTRACRDEEDGRRRGGGGGSGTAAALLPPPLPSPSPSAAE
jgi:DHA1 family tetracycline resistance protein-like MFS transporter